MIENSIEELYNAINNSKEYQEYINIVNTLEKDKEVLSLIEEIKELQKEATNLEYNNDDKYKEIDKKIKEKSDVLNNNSTYQEYLSKMKEFNNVLTASSTLLDEYIEEKVSI